MSLRARLDLARPGFRLAVELEAPQRGVCALHGPSGAGKSTVLRCLAGLEPAARGRIDLGDRCWQDSARHHFLPAHRREIGYVFQDANLFPHLPVRGNLEYGMARVPIPHRRVFWDQVVELFGVGPLLARMPAGLSGGERQRVAMARAVLSSPRLLLMDEPLAALDTRSKAEILPYLERLGKELTIPMVYVSHALDEVLRLADHLILMEGGRTLDAGVPGTLLARHDPGAGDEDAGMVLEARIGAHDDTYHLSRLDFSGGTLWVARRESVMGQLVRVRILARDVSLVLTPHTDSSILNRLQAVVVEASPAHHPAQLRVRLDVDGTPLLASITRRSWDHLDLAPGRRVWAQVKSVAVL
ncbi:MAG TPA: molybdenum ABC transporter ATP-binding protein [Rhodocyclaceae bacterium]|nr:molybdenum ABC transporter ATP-binding protein [Rhodocyclaceae bacterium]